MRRCYDIMYYLKDALGSARSFKLTSSELMAKALKILDNAPKRTTGAEKAYFWGYYDANRDHINYNETYAAYVDKDGTLLVTGRVLPPIPAGLEGKIVLADTRYGPKELWEANLPWGRFWDGTMRPFYTAEPRKEEKIEPPPICDPIPTE